MARSDPAAATGFGKNAPGVERLAEHQNRAWFEPHRQTYEEEFARAGGNLLRFGRNAIDRGRAGRG